MDHVAPLVVQHGIVAQEDVRLPVIDLVEVRHRLEPAVQPPGVLIAGVVVATDQVLMARQPLQQLSRHPAAVPADVSHQIDGVLRTHGVVPVFHQCLVHLLYGGKGPGGKQQCIVKVQIGGIVDHGALPSPADIFLYHTVSAGLRQAFIPYGGIFLRFSGLRFRYAVEITNSPEMGQRSPSGKASVSGQKKERPAGRSFPYVMIGIAYSSVSSAGSSAGMFSSMDTLSAAPSSGTSSSAKWR